MAVKNRVSAIPISSIDSATFVGTYLVLADGLPKACFVIRITNACSVPVLISYDGITQHDYLKAGETLQLPVQNNAQPPGSIANFSKGLKVSVKGLAGIGYIFLAGYYQD